MTPAQAHTRRLKGIAYGYAAAWGQLVIDHGNVGRAEGLTPDDARTVTQILEAIVLDLRNKAHKYESEGAE